MPWEDILERERMQPTDSHLLHQPVSSFEQVEQTLQFQATILANVRESVIVTDLQGKIIYWNEGAQRIFGYCASEMLGKTPALLYPQVEETNLQTDLQRVLAGTDYLGEWEGRRKNGGIVWVDIRTTLLRNRDGEPIGFLGLAKDIHERKLMEEELGKYAAIISSCDDAIVSKTLDGTITSWNQAAERMFGYTAAEAIGQHITLIIPSELHQEEEEIIGKLRQGIRIQHYETVRRRKDGTKLEVSLSISPVKDSAGIIIGAAKIARDITERRELERRKDEFISVASHELKTPITILKGFTQVLLRKLERQGMQGADPMLTKMEAQINRLTRLIDELLDVSKIQAGRLDYDEEPVDLAALLQETVEILQPTTLTHTLIVGETTQAMVMGDKDRLGQVLTNLMNNAIKYSPQANQVDLAITTSNKTVTLRIRDYGVGIPKAHQRHIFERFYRGRDSQNKAFPGLGMGLYIAHEIVKRHGGEITVESEEGKGSTFVVSLPLKK
jgi:PAS domain S-box-containing protein